MDWGLVLAIAHHLAVFSLVAIFAAEFALLRPGLGGERLAQLARIDAAYGAMAGIVIVVGVLRVWLGSVDASYYLGNQAFWGKMLAILAVGLLSIEPTIAIRRWTKAGVVTANEIRRSRRFVHLQAGVFLLIPIFAAAMARGYGS